MRELDQEELPENKKQLLHYIKLFFPDEEIVTLSDLVKNISNCPSVRRGNKGRLDFKDYYEVGLRDCNEEGVIEFDPQTKKDLGAANRSMVEKYALRKNDLLLPYRAARHMKIARVEKEYKFPIVTNPSTIRIEMGKESTEEISICIQAYLDLPYVQRYLIPDSRPSHGKRAALDIQHLRELPIPKFMINSHIDYKEIFTTHLEMASIVQKMQRYNSRVYHNIISKKETTAHLFQNSASDVDTLSHDKELKDRLLKLLEDLRQLESISYELNKDFLEILEEIYPHYRMMTPLPSNKNQKR